MKKLNFGILGAGSIARHMAYTFSMVDEVNAYAVGARDFARARKLADEFGFARAYGSYEELLLNSELDAVYICTPNSHHFEHAKTALLHGKHVLCEKAFTLNAAQAQELLELAKGRGLFIMEAMWTRFLPFVPKLRELMDSGIIGEISSLSVSFGICNPDMPRLHEAELGGGALLDVGVYPITFASLVFGDDIVDTKTSAILTGKGVDAQNSVIFSYAGGRMAVLHSSVLTNLENKAVLCGDKGRMEMDRFWQTDQIRVYVEGEEKPRIVDVPHDFNGYEYEVRAMAGDIAAGKLESSVMPHAETLRMMRLYDSLRARWGMVYPQEKTL